MEKRVSGLVLAGGFSRRMGKNKAELDLCGMSFLQHQVHKLRRLGITDIVIAGYPHAAEGCRCVPDIYPHRGPLSGIHAGLLAIREPRALVLAVDTPLVPEALLEELTERHRAGITAVSCGGETEPLIGVYDKTLAGACEALLQDGNSSLRALFRQVGVSTLEYTGDLRLLLNCNSPEDYKALIALSPQKRGVPNGRMEENPVQSLRHDLRSGDGD